MFADDELNISASNDVANIAGTYGCFLSKWSSQATNDIVLAPSVLREKKVNYVSSNVDVFELSSNVDDVVYLDPPYTKRQYASYYHLLETIVCGDEPLVNRVSGLRPWKEKASVFCYKTKAYRVVISYSNQGHIILENLLDELKPYGKVELVEISTIGRYTPNRVAVSKRGSTMVNDRIKANSSCTDSLYDIAGRMLAEEYLTNKRKPLRKYRKEIFVDYAIDGELDIDSYYVKDVNGYIQTRVRFDVINKYNATIKKAMQIVTPYVSDVRSKNILLSAIGTLGPQEYVKGPRGKIPS